MDDVNILSVAIGVAAFAVGIVMLVGAMRSKPGTSPKATAMLIAGMMITAFGMLMAGFAIGFATSEPLTYGEAAP